MLVSRITTRYPGTNHVAPPATKDEKEYRMRSPPRRNRRASGVVGGSRKPSGAMRHVAGTSYLEVVLVGNHHPNLNLTG